MMVQIASICANGLARLTFVSRVARMTSSQPSGHHWL
jgi:hypothetical protein